MLGGNVDSSTTVESNPKLTVLYSIARVSNVVRNYYKNMYVQIEIV